MLNPRLTLPLSLAAGLLGGLFSHYVSLTTAQAQAAPTEIHAQKFTLVDQNGTVRGVFAVLDDPMRKGGHPVIQLFDIGGREVWSTSPPLEKLANQK